MTEQHPIRRCSILNCGKILQEGEGKIIAGKLYCIECAVFLLKEELIKHGLPLE